VTPDEFVRKWKNVELKERAASQSHFIDLCRMLDEPAPTDVDPKGDWYAFERGATKTTGGEGWADVWKRDHFGWEYKGKRKDLNAAFAQLQQYALALENPPLLVVCDMDRFRVHTNWTNSISQVHEFGLDDLRDANVRQKLKWVFSDPERLKPGKTRQALTEEAAAEFAKLAQCLRDRGHDAEAVAHFINRLVFCMFAEDVDLLPNKMFKRMLEHAATRPDEFQALATDLFKAMQSGGRVGFEQVAWFNGGLFNNDSALPLDRDDIAIALKAARLDWAEVDPSILGTLFERGLDPDKRSQLGAHYTDREKIMMIVDPVIVRPWLAEWERAKTEIATSIDKASAAKNASVRTKARDQATATYREFLNKLRAFRALDPACGSGNFLYLALLALKRYRTSRQHRSRSDGPATRISAGWAFFCQRN
jgi:type II restriction/modification system DNA methylase subunit YeeA